jgi:catechol 2,3-dioxygenase-like lactoylglutathione lyase family enzyme
MPTLNQTIPALPVRDAASAVTFYRDRLGFDVLDLDGNLLTFFRWSSE